MRRPFTSTSLRIMTMTSGSVEYNELNRCMSLAIVGTLPSPPPPPRQESVDINEQLSRRNSLNAICYQSNSIGARVCLRSAHASWIQRRNKQQTTELLIKLFLIHTSNHNVHTICVAHTESG